ncbi:putative lipopolysaccharide heptosyltransferase III [Nitrospira moscoviensis]|uniref:lipopolysaccharide heptosyltransferase II n=1 Tax=Nitrospira moscoviensis TaxID=42253 RepID=A0A0K2GG35_NITMO|nr:putative lipopolysaccharide heptosyltransferase III [Nitrospira moscoviensis]ALA59910.1 putative Lipopolysaccharide heptosyltransferase III [Nitrospira moscoviensis]
MSLRNVLVIKLRYLGDVLLATPALRALKAAHPLARLTVIVNRGTEEILIGNPDVDEVVPLEKTSLMAQMRLVSRLRRRQFDAVIDLTDADRSAFLSWASGARVRIGFNDEGRWRGRCYTAVVRGGPDGHRIERDVAALQPLGITTPGAMPRLWLSADDERRADELLDRLGVRMDRKIVILQPGARYWFKAWPAERFAELADRLIAEYGCQILVGGSRGEGDLARQVAGYAKSRLIPMTDASVKQFAAVAKRAILFIGNDSGAMHIAAAVGTPVIGLFGPSNPREWGPRGERVNVLYKGLDCRACFHPTCTRGELNCMRQISVEAVLKVAADMLRQAAPASQLRTQ